jgi:hypothetical protein
MQGLVPMFWTVRKPFWPAENEDHHCVMAADVLLSTVLMEL